MATVITMRQRGPLAAVSGVLAVLGLLGLMIGAVVYHVRAKDPVKEQVPAAVLGVLAVLYIVALSGN